MLVLVPRVSLFPSSLCLLLPKPAPVVSIILSWTGTDPADVPDVAAFKAEGFKGAETWLCTGKIRRVRPCYVDAFTFLAKNVPADEVKYIKMTMVPFPIPLLI